jgi:hypothetical protein
VGVGTGSCYRDAARERDRLLLVGVGAAAASVTASDFAAERVPRLGVGFALVFGSASAETGAAGVAAEAACAFGLRPSPSCFAIVWNAAPNRQGRSKDGLSAIPIASDIHPGSDYAVYGYADAASWLGTWAHASTAAERMRGERERRGLKVDEPSLRRWLIWWLF